MSPALFKPYQVYHLTTLITITSTVPHYSAQFRTATATLTPLRILQQHPTKLADPGSNGTSRKQSVDRS